MGPIGSQLGQVFLNRGNFSGGAELSELVKPLSSRCEITGARYEQPTRLEVWQGGSPCTVNCLYSDG
jgi:hypothetical protein